MRFFIIMTYKASPIGNEISCVMYDITTEILNNNNRLEQILLEALTKDNFKILDKVSHKFQHKDTLLLFYLQNLMQLFIPFLSIIPYSFIFIVVEDRMTEEKHLNI